MLAFVGGDGKAGEEIVRSAGGCAGGGAEVELDDDASISSSNGTISSVIKKRNERDTNGEDEGQETDKIMRTAAGHVAVERDSDLHHLKND
ncbi:hypothetical protein LguiB_033680 [Lonicera macranthoides]